MSVYIVNNSSSYCKERGPSLFIHAPRGHVYWIRIAKKNIFMVDVYLAVADYNHNVSNF